MKSIHVRNDIVSWPQCSELVTADPSRSFDERSGCCGSLTEVMRTPQGEKRITTRSESKTRYRSVPGRSTHTVTRTLDSVLVDCFGSVPYMAIPLYLSATRPLQEPLIRNHINSRRYGRKGIAYSVRQGAETIEYDRAVFFFF